MSSSHRSARTAAVQGSPLAPALLGTVLLLTACGFLAVWSATWDPGGRLGLGREAWQQLTWWGISLATALAAGQLPFRFWRSLALPGFIACLLVSLAMLALAGTALVPVTRGQANWVAVGSLRLQPIEFIKIGTLLACSLLVGSHGFEARRLGGLAWGLGTAGLPSLLHARTDLGSSLTFLPMILGMLWSAGMRLRHLLLLLAGLLLVLAAGVMLLPQEGPKAYQWRRIQAWLDPDAYALTEAYQTSRSISSIGSGQLAGKGWSQGDQNRLGWIPEKHTDLIFAVVGEETGFLGCAFVLLLYLALGWLCLLAAGRVRDPCARCYLAGWASLILGQAAINLAVATRLMPVTGVTLPFFSYGGSSLLACHLGLGLALSAARSERA